MGFVPAGAFAVAAMASTAGVRWALVGPGLVIAAFAALAALGLSRVLSSGSADPFS